MHNEKNEFKVINFRTQVGNPDILIVRGFFSQNDQGNTEVLFVAGKKRLKAKLIICEGREIRKAHLTDACGVDKEYYWWVPLPKFMNKKGGGIVVLQRNNNKIKKISSIKSSEILKLKQQVESDFDAPKILDGKIHLTGWYVSLYDQAEIRLTDDQKKDQDYIIKENYRPDVIARYPEVSEEAIHGLEINLDYCLQKRLKLNISIGNENTQYTFLLNPSKLNKAVSEIKKLCEKSQVYLKRNGWRKWFQRVHVKLFKTDKVSYMKWRIKHQPDNRELKRQRETNFNICPKISIVVPLYKTQSSYLSALVESIKEQTYENWELCLSDGSGKNSPLENLLKDFGDKSKKICVVHNDKPLRISENTNQAIAIATGDYIAFMDHDDLLSPDALFECVKAINQNPDIDMLYSDEDKITMDGKEYFEPHFKTDFNENLLCSMNYICHLCVVKKEIVDTVGTLRKEYDGAQDYDFALRVSEITKKIYHIPKVLYHWRAHKDSTAENPDSKRYAFDAGRRAVQGHYDRVGIPAIVHEGEYPGLYRTEHLLKEKPLISILIPNKDHIKDLDKCISSIETKSHYENYEYVIIENNSEKEETFYYYEQLKKTNPKVKVVYWKDEFNYSAINNFGRKYAKGEYLLLLNNDTEVINENCLEELIGYCMHKNVGAVGARLYYDDDTIQHAGVIVGFGGIAGHAFLGYPRTENGYFSRIICAQNLSAVTAACMMVKATVFDQVGGFDETLKVAFNDIDFCMKITQAGYLIVYNPYAEFYHYESKSRGKEDTKEKVERFNSEIMRFAEKWPDILKNGDPYYNPNLSIDRGDFGLK